MTALPLLMRYRHPRLRAVVWIFVGRRVAVARAPLLRLLSMLGAAMLRVALMGGTVVMPLGRARLSKTGQRYAEHQRGAKHGQGFLHVLLILCMLMPGASSVRLVRLTDQTAVLPSYSLA